MEITVVEIVLFVFIAGTIGGLIFFVLKLRKLQAHYEHLTQGVKGGNLEELLTEHLKRISQQEREMKKLTEAIDRIQMDGKQHFQQIGFKRFNPFEQTGGDQSFALALLDADKNGFILSSLHQRDVTRVYAKLINQGESEHKLSAEEQEVLDNISRK